MRCKIRPSKIPMPWRFDSILNNKLAVGFAERNVSQFIQNHEMLALKAASVRRQRALVHHLFKFDNGFSQSWDFA
jgi:hypothetical protein